MATVCVEFSLANLDEIPEYSPVTVVLVQDGSS
jgi:hypothetical protein